MSADDRVATDSGRAGARGPVPWGPALFALAGTVVLAALSLIAWSLDGAGGQLPPWESGMFHANAVSIKNAIADRGLRGFAEAWVHVSGTHAPLVPSLSALLMCIFGESIRVAESAQWLFTFLLLFSLVRCSQTFFSNSRLAPYAVAGMFVTFPVVINQSRMYLFEHALAATTAAAVAALVHSDRLTRLWNCLLFGFFAGLACVSRTGGGVYLVGPVIVYMIYSLRGGSLPRKAWHLALAALVAGSIAASWYVPNWETLRTYLYSVTYGVSADVFAGRGGSLQAGNLLFIAQWLILDGPGMPLAALAAICYAGACIACRRVVLTGTAVAVAAAFFMDVSIVFFASQQCGAQLLLPALSVLAVAVVAAIAIVPAGRWRVAAALLAAAFSIHHLYDLTARVDFRKPERVGMGPFPSFPLWNHDEHFASVAQAVGAHPATDFTTPIRTCYQIISDERAKRKAAGTPSGAKPVLVVASFHPFFHPSNFQWLAARNRYDYDFIYPPAMTAERAMASPMETRDFYRPADYLVVRWNTGWARTPAETALDTVLQPMLSGDARTFDAIGEPVTMGDGSTARVYAKIPAWRGAMALEPGDPNYHPVTAEFSTESTAGAAIDGYSIYQKDGEFVIDVRVRRKFGTPPDRVRLVIEELEGERRFEIPADSPARQPPAPAELVRLSLREHGIPPRIDTRGFRLMIRAGQSGQAVPIGVVQPTPR